MLSDLEKARFETLEDSEEKIHVKILQRIYLKYNKGKEADCLCNLADIKREKKIYYNWYYGTM